MAARADAGRGGGARRRDAPAGRRVAGRAHRPHPDACVLRRPRRGAQRDRRPRHGAWHEPGQRCHGRLHARGRQDRPARQHRRRRPPRQGGAADRRADAHQPVDARPLRGAHHRDRRHLPRRRRAPLLRRRQPERGVRHLAPRRHGLRRRPLQPAQDVLAAARRRRPGRRPGGGARRADAVPARAAHHPQRRRVRLRLGRAEDDRQGAGVRGPVRRVRPLLRVHADVGPGAPAHVRGRRAQRQLRALPAQATSTTCRSTASACTSSSSRRGRSGASTE